MSLYIETATTAKSQKYVKNIENAKDDEVGSHWLKYWEKKTGKKCPSVCQVVDCDNLLKTDDEKIAPVWLCDSKGFISDENKRYIVPLCSACTTATKKIMRLKDDADIVMIAPQDFA